MFWSRIFILYLKYKYSWPIYIICVSRNIENTKTNIYQSDIIIMGGGYKFIDIDVSSLFLNKDAEKIKIYKDFLSKSSGEWCSNLLGTDYIHKRLFTADDLGTLTPEKAYEAYKKDISIMYSDNDGIYDYNAFALINPIYSGDSLYIDVICAKTRGSGTYMLFHINDYTKKIGKHFIKLESIGNINTYTFYIKNGFYFDKQIYSIKNPKTNKIENDLNFEAIYYKLKTDVYDGNTVSAKLNFDFDKWITNKYSSYMSAIIGQLAILKRFQQMSLNPEDMNIVTSTIKTVNDTIKIATASTNKEDIDILMTIVRQIMVVRKNLDKYGKPPEISDIEDEYKKNKILYSLNVPNLIPLIKPVDYIEISTNGTSISTIERQKIRDMDIKTSEELLNMYASYKGK